MRVAGHPGVLSQFRYELASDQIAASLARAIKAGLGGRSFASHSHQCFMYVTPTPILSWLERLDNRVIAVVEMLPRMPMGRGVAAADATAGQAYAQMQPRATDHQAILAAVGTR
jgi:hypothetical protein